MKNVTDIANKIINQDRPQPWTESERESRNQEDKNKIQHLWVLMTSMYGHKWVSSYGELVDQDNVWLACLKGISLQEIKQGLSKLALSGDTWPPSAPEFRSLCDGTAEAKDAPRGADAAAQRMFNPEGLIERTTHAERQAKGRVEMLAIKKMLAKK